MSMLLGNVVIGSDELMATCQTCIAKPYLTGPQRSSLDRTASTAAQQSKKGAPRSKHGHPPHMHILTYSQQIYALPTSKTPRILIN